MNDIVNAWQLYPVGAIVTILRGNIKETKTVAGHSFVNKTCNVRFEDKTVIEFNQLKNITKGIAQDGKGIGRNISGSN